MRFRLDEENFLPLGVLINKLRCVKIASQRGRVYRAHAVDGDKLKSMLYIICRLLRMSLLVALPDSTDVGCLHVSGVFDAIVRQLPQKIHAPAVYVSHAPAPQISRLSSQSEPTCDTAKLHFDATQELASPLVSADSLGERCRRPPTWVFPEEKW